MEFIGIYQSRDVYWFDFAKFQLEQLPIENWICLATSNTTPDLHTFKTFVRHSIDNGILEFKGHGKFGEKLHDVFDEMMIDIETAQNVGYMDISTTCHNNESLANVFGNVFLLRRFPIELTLII